MLLELGMVRLSLEVKKYVFRKRYDNKPSLSVYEINDDECYYIPDFGKITTCLICKCLVDLNDQSGHTDYHKNVIDTFTAPKV